MAIFVCVCVWEIGRDNKRDTFSVSLVTLFQHVIHVDKCLKQSPCTSELGLYSRDWTVVKMDSGDVLNVALGSELGIVGSIRPGTDVALTFEMSQGVKV